MGLVGAPARERARGRAASGLEAGPAIVARGLGYMHRSRRGDRRGIHAIDLTVPRGAVVGMLGPNGAGKSTLLGVLMTRLAPGSGEVRLLGEDAGRADASLRRRIGCAPDEPVHFAHLTGLENAVLFGRAAGMSEAAARASAERLLERFGLAADAHRAAGDYSLGMRRKLLLCEALVAAPELLLLDEPTLGLDARSRDALASELKANSATGAAIVIATNDLPFAAMVCDRVAFLREGRMVLEGTPAALLDGIGAATWIEIGLEAGGPPRNPPPGVALVDATDAVLRFRASAGGAILPSLCQALLAEGCDIRSVQIREPDLRDVFNAVTGESWTPAAADAP